MDLESNDSIRSDLRRLAPDGDLTAVADDMRRMGVDSLLICRPGGRIANVVSEHRVRRLAQPESPAPPGIPFIPEQIAMGAERLAEPSAEGEGIRAQTG